MTGFPKIDGHYWDERDNKIIDKYFKEEYDLLKKTNCLTGDRIYLEADKLTQKLMITKFNKDINKYFGTPTSTTEEDYKTFRDIIVNAGVEPSVYRCFQNCVVEIVNNGGVLKFGSMGWKKKTGGIHYEYGGDGWKFHQFLSIYN